MAGRRTGTTDKDVDQVFADGRNSRPELAAFAQRSEQRPCSDSSHIEPTIDQSLDPQWNGNAQDEFITPRPANGDMLVNYLPFGMFAPGFLPLASILG